MSNFSDIWGGFVIMIACCLIGLVMALVGGLVLDNVYGNLDDQNWFDNADPDWTGDDWGNLMNTMNLYYGLCFLWPIVGFAAFIKTVIARQGYDQYLYQ